MTKLIVICGLPGTGKSTLADALSKHMKITCISKDGIKESLYDYLQLKTLEDSRRIGKQSVDILLNLAEKHIQQGLDVIIEAPFRVESDYDNFIDWKSRYDIKFYAFICAVSVDVRKERFVSRPRHAAHHDSERRFAPESDEIYHKLPENKLWLDTAKPIDDLLSEVLETLGQTRA